jgi:hypothetical protein
LQRFISEDPIEFKGGDINLYGYVANKPLVYSDPLGLSLVGFLLRILGQLNSANGTGLGGLINPDCWNGCPLNPDEDNMLIRERIREWVREQDRKRFEEIEQLKKDFDKLLKDLDKLPRRDEENEEKKKTKSST